MHGLQRWVVAILLLVGGPASVGVGVVDVPRVIIAGDHIGNAFLQRPNTRVWVQLSGAETLVTGLRPTPREPRPSVMASMPPPASFLLLGAAMLVAARRIRRRARNQRSTKYV